MPSLLAKGEIGNTTEKKKPAKITKKVRTKKKKTTTGKKPPRQASPTLGQKNRSMAIGGSTDNIQRKS